MTRLAFLGTGLIGGALAEAAAKRGDDVVAWNRTRTRAEALQEFGVEVRATPAGAVRGVERVHLAFPDDEVIEKVLAPVLGEVAEEAVIVDHTTASPAKTAARGRRLAADGVRYLHAPVLMSPASCREATGMMLVSGPESVYRDVVDGLEEMTGSVRYLGDDMGRAAGFKLFGNATIVSLIGGLADVFAMAAELDIAPDDAFSLFDDFDPSGVMGYRGKSMSEGEYAPAFTLEMARKDVGLMLETADDEPLAVLPGLAQRMDELIAEGHGDKDLGVLAVDSVPPDDGS